MSLLKTFRSLCTPAIASLILGVIAILGSITQVSIIFSIIHLIVTIVWALFLDFLCSKGFGALSWFLVLFPYIIVSVFLIFFIKTAIDQDKKKGSKK